MHKNFRRQNGKYFADQIGTATVLMSIVLHRIHIPTMSSCEMFLLHRFPCKTHAIMVIIKRYNVWIIKIWFFFFFVCCVEIMSDFQIIFHTHIQFHILYAVCFLLFLFWGNNNGGVCFRKIYIFYCPPEKLHVSLCVVSLLVVSFLSIMQVGKIMRMCGFNGNVASCKMNVFFFHE